MQPTDPKAVASATNPAAAPVPIEDLYYTRVVTGASWSPDGKTIAFATNLTGRINLWKVDAAGGWPIQMSRSEERQGASTWSPDGKWIYFHSDFGGNEQYDTFAVPAAGGATVNLTNSPEFREQATLISPDGATIAVHYKAKTAASEDIGLVDVKARAVRNLTNEADPKYNWEANAWSPDGKYLYATRGTVGGFDASVYRVEVASGKKEELTPHAGEKVYNASDVSPDGKTVLLTSNEPGGYMNVALLDVATRKLAWVTRIEWEAEAKNFSPDGKWFTYQINEDGRTDVYLASRATLKAEKLPLPPGMNTLAGNPSAFSPDGGRVLVAHQDSTRPADLWIYDVRTRAARQLTHSALASLEARNLPQSQIVHYQTFDGKVISALLWMPFNLKRDASHPALVLPHGGPTGQTVDNFSQRAIALASRGYILIAPNVRGSTGYGMEFQKANYQDLGGGDLQDEVYAAKWLAQTGYVDAKKIGITGGSYGGFMTLMAIGKTPEVWAAAVNIFGVLDWKTMMQHSDPLLQQYIVSLLGDPVNDAKVYADTSPIKYLGNVRAPLLVLQGENDIRVPKEESDQVVDLLKKQGKTVEVVYYPHEGHGFAKRENQIDSLRRTVEWFDKYLKGAPAE
ncbi:MAG TPA: S9 family peptidase [Terriglobales bacterium]|nr:S9 family peptidase [Terriglobales bacterium]